MRGLILLSCLVALLLAVRPAAGEPLHAQGPAGALEGEMIPVPDAAHGVIIIPGSGPTDRDGNSPMGMRSDSYRLLAEGLSSAGFSTLRIDKRGFFGSAAAIVDAEDVTIEDYANDLGLWLDVFAERSGARCVWIAGHSEGGLVALVAAARGLPACGLILLATSGRPIGELMREQFASSPANAPLLDELDRLLGGLEKGELQDEQAVSPALRPLFRPGLQRYMIQLFAYDPLVQARRVTLPVLVVQGDSDIQVKPKDARLLAEALPNAELVLISGLTHMLKQDVPGEPYATYQDPALPLDAAIVPEIARFIERSPRE